MSSNRTGPVDAPSKKIVFVHVGAPKTGTTFLQRVLWKNRDVLAEDGLLYPFQRPDEHRPMGLDLRQMSWGGHRNPAWEGSWRRVAERVRTWTGPGAVISEELLGGATEVQARLAVDSLQPADVHVVFTARDLALQLPSDWQEQIKHAHTVALREFVRDLVELGINAPAPFGEMFWGLHDPVGVLARWSAAVPVDRVHIVTVPPPGAPRDVLWKRFACLLGIDPLRYDPHVPSTNISIGMAETEMLRRINRVLGNRLGGQYESLVRVYLAETVLAARPAKTKIVLPPEYHTWAVERSKELIDGLRDARYDVVGDLEELVPSRPPPRADTRSSAEDVPTEAQLDAAVDGEVGLLELVARVSNQKKGLEKRVGQLAGELAGRRTHPIKTLVRDISERHPSVRLLRIGWWHLVEWSRSSPVRPRGGVKSGRKNPP